MVSAKSQNIVASKVRRDCLPRPRIGFNTKFPACAATISAIRAGLIVASCVFFFFTGCTGSETDNNRTPEKASVAKAPTDDTSLETYPDMQEPSLIESSISFYGWLGDSAVLVEESYTEDGNSLATYYQFRPGDEGMEPLDTGMSAARISEIVQGGIEVLTLRGADPKAPYLELYSNHDSSALASIQQNIGQLSFDEELPDPIPGLLVIVWHVPGAGADTLWQDSAYVGPYYGEASVELHVPSINYAELSPSRRALMVALWLDDYIEYFVFKVTDRSH